MKKGSFWKNYGFLILMLTGIVAGCIVGAIWPAVMEVVDGETILSTRARPCSSRSARCS